MTAFDRIEHHLPELMDELAAARVPDYFDDMLQRSSQTRQRPAWSALERWLPVGTIARPVPIRPVPWRLVALVAMLAILATATFVYVGSRSDDVPPPFGVAKNGNLVIGTAEGDIVTVDPATGATTPLISGATIDNGPAFLRDGLRFIFDRRQTPTSPPALFIANADGSGVRELFPAGTDIGSFDQAPTGESVLITPMVDGKREVQIVSLSDGTATNVPTDLAVVGASWRPGHDQIILTTEEGGYHAFWVVDADGSNARKIVTSRWAINDPTLSPDGSRLAYATWQDVPRIRVVDIDDGGDRLVTTKLDDGYVWQDPQFSPDGQTLLIRRFIANTYKSQLALVSIEGSDSGTALGPLTENPPPDAMFSPDGTTILATYPTTLETWMFDVDGSNAREVPFVAIAGQSWQRQAP